MDKNNSTKLTLAGIIFSIVAVAAFVAIYLLAGRKTADGTVSGSAASTPSPSPTAEVSVTAAPVVTPYGRTEEQVVSALVMAGYQMAKTDDGYQLTPPVEEDVSPDPSEQGILTLATDGGIVTGFVLAFPVIDSSFDQDESLISAALDARAQDMPARQAKAMEAAFYAVFSAYDPQYDVPATMRSEWCAQYLNLQAADNKKSSEDKSGSFRFAVYPYGSGTALRYCCSVQKNG